MNRFTTLIVGTALTVTVDAGAALAGSPTPAPVDPVVPAPVAPMPVTGDWTGGYFGGSLAYGDWDLGAANGTGRNEGAFAGYDYDFGSYVAGGEVQYIGHDVVVGGAKLQDMWRVKGRLGYDAGKTLIYGTAGYASASTNAGDSDGYVAGVGFDYRFDNNITLGAEYLYNEFDNIGGNKLSGNTIEARIGYRF